jgi:hypothetical protein
MAMQRILGAMLPPTPQEQQAASMLAEVPS